MAWDCHHVGAEKVVGGNNNIVIGIVAFNVHLLGVSWWMNFRWVGILRKVSLHESRKKYPGTHTEGFIAEICYNAYKVQV